MKKFICLAIAIMSLITSCVFATNTTFSDVKGTKYEDSVNMLVTFGIINGYDDGTFKPDTSVTRVQLAKMLVVAMGHEDEVEDAKKKFLNFSDVLSSHWGYGYIKIASDMKLINGYTDGTFLPDKEVTYAEATTMFLRALEFEKAVNQSTLSWPNNYMTYASEELELFEGLPSFKAASNAPRGDIAMLLWNTLRTGTAEIVKQTEKGGMVYGPGTAMITKYMNYIYVSDAEIKDIEFDDNFQTAKVTLKEENKVSQKIEVNAEEVLEMFGKKVTVLYDQKNKKILKSNYNTDYKEVNGEVSNVSKEKIYLTNRSTGYNLPDDDDNILLFGIDDLYDAIEVYLLVEGNSIKYCVAKGASEVLPGLIADDYVEIGDDTYGVTLLKLDEKKGGTDYYLANEDKWPEEDDIVLYFVNADDLLMILDTVSVADAEIVDLLEDDLIEVHGDEYKLTEDNYEVILVKKASLQKAELEDIDVKQDMVCVKTYGMQVFIFVWEDEIMDSIDPDLADALYDLEDIIEEALEYDEALYTQESYADLMKEVSYGQKLDHTFKLKKIQNAVIAIEESIEYLDDDLSRNEKKIVAAKKELREFINDECADIIKDEFDYTDDSYEDFEDMYYAAIEVLEMYDAILDEVNEAYENLESAIDDLELIEE